MKKYDLGEKNKGKIIAAAGGVIGTVLGEPYTVAEELNTKFKNTTNEDIIKGLEELNNLEEYINIKSLNNYTIKQQYILASNGIIKPSEFIRELLLKS